MSDDETTTISLTRETRNRLFGEKQPGDSYDDVVRRLLSSNDDS